MKRCTDPLNPPGLFFDKGAFNHIIALNPAFGRNLKAKAVEHFAGVFQHGGATADHAAIRFGIQRRDLEIGKQFSRLNQVGQAPLVLEGFPGYRWVIEQLFAHLVTKILVERQDFGDESFVGQFTDRAHAVYQNDLFVLFVGIRVLNQTHEGCEARSRGEHKETLARFQVGQDEGAGRFFADQQLVANFDVLKERSQRSIGHFDAEKFEVFFVIGASNTISPHQGSTVDFQADHDELSVFEPEPLVTGGFKAEQRFVPVINVGDSFFDVVAHGAMLCGAKRIILMGVSTKNRTFGYKPVPRW